MEDKAHQETLVHQATLDLVVIRVTQEILEEMVRMERLAM